MGIGQSSQVTRRQLIRGPAQSANRLNVRLNNLGWGVSESLQKRLIAEAHKLIKIINSFIDILCHPKCSGQH